MRALCEQLNVDFHQAVEGFRDFVDSSGTGAIPSALQSLQIAINTSSVISASADAERGFSSMNVICSALRSSLAIPHLSHWMFTSLIGPELPDFHPTPYLRSWLAKGHRHAADNQSTVKEMRTD